MFAARLETQVLHLLLQTSRVGSLLIITTFLMVQHDLISSDAFAAIHLMAYCHAMNCTTNEQAASYPANHHHLANVAQHDQL